MTIYSPNIERWRNKAENALVAVLTNFPKWKSLQDRFIAPIEGGGATLILSLVQTESSGNPDTLGDPISGAVARPSSYWTRETALANLSRYNSVGLMQLNWGAGTPQGIGYAGDKAGLLDPAVNLYWGVKYLFQQLERYQDLDRAVLAYNAGSYRTDDAGAPINLEYLRKVLAGVLEKKTSFISFSELLASLRSSGDAAADQGPSPAIAASDEGHKNAADQDRPQLENVTAVTPAGRSRRSKLFGILLTVAGAIVAALVFALRSCS